jgi:agmatinase
MADFDPNGVGLKGALFGLPYTVNEAKIVVLPVPWDVTVSYRSGTCKAPAQMLDESSQIDYFLLDKPHAWKTAIAMAEIPGVWQSLSENLRLKAVEYINWLEDGSPSEQRDAMLVYLKEINDECTQLMRYVEQESSYYRDRDQKTILLGGDHSTPLGHIKACLSTKLGKPVGILQIDAHADLRKAYEGFKYSHASVMWNVLQETNVDKLVQLGVRDLCEEEAAYIRDDERITTFYHQTVRDRLFHGEYWSVLCDEIIHNLPQHVYVSVDIDGLNPSLCPQTGTPVPGGLTFDELTFLFTALKKSGKEVIGADLVEVGNAEWDANVGARVLWQLVHLMDE